MRMRFTTFPPGADVVPGVCGRSHGVSLAGRPATPAAVDVGRIDAAAAREGAAVVGKRNPGVLIIREGHGGGPSTGPPCSSTAIEMMLSLMPLFCPDRYRPIIEGLPTRAVSYRPPMPGPSSGTRSSTTPTPTAPLIEDAAFGTVALRDAIGPIGQITESLPLFRALRQLTNRQSGPCPWAKGHRSSADSN